MPNRRITFGCSSERQPDGTWTVTIEVAGVTREEAEAFSDAAFEPVRKVAVDVLTEDGQLDHRIAIEIPPKDRQ